MNIFVCFYFRAARLEREKCENKCSAKMSTFTVSWLSQLIIAQVLSLCVGMLSMLSKSNNSGWDWADHTCAEFLIDELGIR